MQWELKSLMRRMEDISDISTMKINNMKTCKSFLVETGADPEKQL